MYHAGTLAQFNTWHNTAMTAEGITPEGKVGFCNGKAAPEAQKTIAYSSPFIDPKYPDKCMWLYGKYKDSKYLAAASVPDSWQPDYVA